MFRKCGCLLVVVLLAGCNTTVPKRVAPTPPKPKTIDLTPSVFTAMQKGISVNGSSLDTGQSIEIPPGITTVKFDGESVYSEVISEGPRKDHREIKTIACIALLPLCPAIMSLNTEGNAEVRTQKVQCSGSTAIDIHPGGTYLAEIVEDAVTYPTLVIQEVIPNRQRKSKGALKCTKMEDPVGGNI